jgi:uncharacterized membrane protein (UPF0127 family)
MWWRSKVRSNRAAAFLAVPLLLAAALGGAGGCGARNPSAGAAGSSPALQPAGPRVIFPDGTVIHVEVASDEATREQGLMYRDQLAEDRGMIFLFPQPGIYPFWMKNTLIPLDMIWIDGNHHVVDVAANVPPCKADPCPSVPPKGSALFVLETAAGVAAKHRVAKGAPLRFEGLDGVVVR